MKLQIDDLDARIIRELQVNGRLANTELARRLGVGEATVRKRIDRMLSSKLIQVVAWADPLKVGYQHFAIIGIQVKVPEIERAAKKLAKMPEIFSLVLCTGEFDIIANALFHSNEHIRTFVVDFLAKVPGIQRTSTLSVLRIVKREFVLPTTDKRSRRQNGALSKVALK